LDEAARQFSEAFDKVLMCDCDRSALCVPTTAPRTQNMSPKEFVDSMGKQKKLIVGIGHVIKSVQVR
jgi:hypothetical protein